MMNMKGRACIFVRGAVLPYVLHNIRKYEIRSPISTSHKANGVRTEQLTTYLRWQSRTWGGARMGAGTA